jgi:sigma-E factor negative regulatory protein RseB
MMTPMRQAPIFIKVVVAVSGLFFLLGEVQAADIASEKRDAEQWLQKIHVAAQKLDYSGTFVYQQANQVRTSRITHIADGKKEVEKLEVLDGKPREYIRNNEEILCYVPETRTLLVEKRVTRDVFPALLTASSPSALTDYYNVRKLGSGRVAGHDSQMIALEPKDNLRYGYHLWADTKTGLLLRAQTVNEHGEIVEQISFTQIEIGRINRNRVRSEFANNTQGWHVENAVMHQVDLPGWSVKAVPPGFKKIREVKRLVSDKPAQNVSHLPGKPTPSQREVAQIVFSDGMAAISVFIEPGNSGRAEGTAQQGAMNIMGKRQGDFWLTIVGEVPAAAIKQVANSIEFKTK